MIDELADIIAFLKQHKDQRNMADPFFWEKMVDALTAIDRRLLKLEGQGVPDLENHAKTEKSETGGAFGFATEGPEPD